MRMWLLLAVLPLVFVACADEETLYYTHLHGFTCSLLDADTQGVNGLKLWISDINPENSAVQRSRTVVTHTADDSNMLGYFEIDSVCFATSSHQAAQIVRVYLDSLDNPEWKTQWWYPDPKGPVDTVYLRLAF